jgi:hypothetical protein
METTGRSPTARRADAANIRLEKAAESHSCNLLKGCRREAAGLQRDHETRRLRNTLACTHRLGRLSLLAARYLVSRDRAAERRSQKYVGRKMRKSGHTRKLMALLFRHSSLLLFLRLVHKSFCFRLSKISPSVRHGAFSSGRTSRPSRSG